MIMRMKDEKTSTVDDGYVSTKEISALFKVSRATVLRWTKRGCPCIRANKRLIRFKVNAVTNWLYR